MGKIMKLGFNARLGKAFMSSRGELFSFAGHSSV
jgi:hypothetical protein